MGYTAYQSDWPEQTPAATKMLRSALYQAGLALVLPCYNLASKDAAIERLTQHGIDSASLEQKCIRQVHNLILDDAALRAELEIWRTALRYTLHELSSIKVELIEKACLGDI